MIGLPQCDTMKKRDFTFLSMLLNTEKAKITIQIDKTKT